MENRDSAYGRVPLPQGIRSCMAANGNGLDMHYLEAGFEEPGRPCALLLHGFPELAYSWRRVMPALAEAGFHVVAPDQRGYGRTTGWVPDYDADLSFYRLFNLVRDVMGLLDALGRKEVALLAGHDYGASVAAWAALIRPDIFRRLVLMSAPFPGPPDISPQMPPARSIHADLAALDRPRKHYHWYYSTRQANADMQDCRQGVHAFLRAYFHHKSADWEGNRPFRLDGWRAEELARMPTYYIMDLDRTMAETVAAEMPGADEIAACRWLPDAELAVYAQEYGRTGFQGGLNWYRCRTSGLFDREHELFSGRHIEVPACFISGVSDWGVYQAPGALEAMEAGAAAWAGTWLVEGAGHWVQQERPDAVSARLAAFAAGRAAA
ncbi:MAG: alpha/beta hydrolase [Alphaproteobacteria bacterium]|nr:alpha/beta hydrolase [Alphaproteobacteria bacterium]